MKTIEHFNHYAASIIVVMIYIFIIVSILYIQAELTELDEHTQIFSLLPSDCKSTYRKNKKPTNSFNKFIVKW